MKTPRAFDSETCGYLSILFLTAALVAAFISIFVNLFARVAILSFIFGVALAFYAVSIKYK